MPLGGIDVVLLAPAQECVGDMILRACRRHWPREKCLFQEARDEVNVYPLDDPWVWAVGTGSKEFFVYQNEDAVKAWDADGATPANSNTMLHFIVGDADAKDPGMVEVALVCDKLTPDVRALIADLKAAFLSGISGSRFREAA